jgi:23S rRNA (cytidine1920-2'-O)/16S rRNA (cytidine1409-2'-O)-methyltransferase
LRIARFTYFDAVLEYFRAMLGSGLNEIGKSTQRGDNRLTDKRVPSPAMTATRQRADRLLVERGLFESRAKAQAAVEAGRVSVSGVAVRKASDELPVDADIQATPAHPYVSRGGLKLAAALDHFGFEPEGRVCLDVGASTGGFTQVLRERGAKHVHAVDVGRNQLHASLRGLPDVTALEETDIRALASSRLSEPPSLAVVDVSFISLKLALPAITALVAPGAQLVALIKPQFEAGRAHLKKGVVRDADVQRAVCDDIRVFTGALGWRVVGVIPSPIEGGDGNREFLLGASRD